MLELAVGTFAAINEVEASLFELRDELANLSWHTGTYPLGQSCARKKLYPAGERCHHFDPRGWTKLRLKLGKLTLNAVRKGILQSV